MELNRGRSPEAGTGWWGQPQSPPLPIVSVTLKGGWMAIRDPACTVVFLIVGKWFSLPLLGIEQIVYEGTFEEKHESA